MASTSGLSGGQGYNVVGQGQVELPDGVFDVTTAEGYQAVQGALSSTALDSLTAELEGQHLRAEGDRFVMVAANTALNGPRDVSQGLSDVDKLLRDNVYEAAGVAFPYNANTTPGIERTIHPLESRTDSVSALQGYLEEPTAQNRDQFFSHFTRLRAATGELNIHEVLFLVFRQSIEETNKDKEYFLKKLREYNDMAEGLSEYLKELVDASTRLAQKSEGKKYPEKERISVEIKEFDLSTPGADGKLVTTGVHAESVNRHALNDHIKLLESHQETIRNKRQMTSTSFQNFDQKSNQLYQLLASVLKTTNEMRAGTVRNML